MGHRGAIVIDRSGPISLLQRTGLAVLAMAAMQP